VRQVQDGRGAALEARPRVSLLLPACAAATVAADQATKAWALARLEPGERVDVLGEILGFWLARNPGGIFGILPGATAAFTLLTAVIVVLVVVWAVRSREFPALFGIVIGGGLGNLADRLIRGEGTLSGRVVDFIDLSFWPTFNLADAAISIGVLLLILRGSRTSRH
jgi:signal peptidase II